ncbi:unnamed protein product [Arctia plantaginis]|uniref:V-type proton ATPase subunit n=1 Tax=Arctia plantaginis TaxID=874455 RepID=A0A8S0YWP6_ARCPL|nr:unnamed protein product [Arctia plantaginis]CAB3253695.1 unnamed protein product [Arctia plantaginis]
MSTLPKDALNNPILRSDSSDNAPYFPIYVVTAVMAGVFVVGPIVVPRGPHRGLIRVSLMLTTISLWLFWVTIYIAQINPLMGPRMDNASLAWIGYCWGEDPKKVGLRLGLPPDSDIPELPVGPPEPPPEF